MKIGIFDPYLDDMGGGEKYMMSIGSVLSEKFAIDVFWDNKKDLDLVGERFGIDTTKFHLVKNIFKPETSLISRFLQTQKYFAIIFLSDGSIPLVGGKNLFVHIQQPLENIQNNLLGKIKIDRVNKFFYNSVYTQKFINNKFHLQSEVIYPPVFIPEKIFNDSNAKKENIILHVGRFRVKNVNVGDYKKQFIMVKTFKEMVDRGLKNWKFVLAVSFSQKEQEEFDTFKKAADGYPIDFLINKTNDELWHTYAKAKIYWHASGFGEDLDSHPEFAEHFGISTVEAMGAGVVPVVINAGGQREIVKNGENGFLWDSLDDLKRETLELINNKELLEKLSVSAKKTSQEFGFEKFKVKILKMIS